MPDISNNSVHLSPALSYNWLQARIQICLHIINNWWQKKEGSFVILELDNNKGE